MLKLRTIKKAIKKAQQFYSRHWEKGQDVYVVLASVEYNMEDEYVVCNVRWGNDTQDVHHSELSIFVYDYITKIPRDLACYIMGLIHAEENRE